jgi:hypothetical protein
MLKLSRNLLDNMDRFVIDRSGQTSQRRQGAAARRPSSAQEARDYELAEVSRS